MNDTIDSLIEKPGEEQGHTFPQMDPEHCLTVVIVGIGNVGSALWNIFLHSAARVIPVDPGRDYPAVRDTADHLHICIPYHDDYVNEAVTWVASYEPSHVFLHALLPLGTTRKVMEELKVKGFSSTHVAHMPTMGEHPLLSEQFPRYLNVLGTDDMGAAKIAAEHLLQLGGIKTAALSSPEETEFASLVYYARLALDRTFVSFIKEVCKEKNIIANQVVYGWTEIQDRSRILTKIGDSQVLPNVNFDANPHISTIMTEALGLLAPVLKDTLNENTGWKVAAKALIGLAACHADPFGGFLIENWEHRSRKGGTARRRSGHKRQRGASPCEGTDTALVK